MTSGVTVHEPAANDPAGTITIGSDTFRDLDHDGVLAPYEDWRLPAEARVADLLGRMTLAEKAGCMLHGTAAADHPELGHIGVGDRYDVAANTDLIARRSIVSMITRLNVAPDEFARQNNALQAIAARSRLGIPVTVSSDPRHHFGRTLGASNAASSFSQWPEPLGLGALGSVELARRFGDVLRQELAAVGIRLTLSPQADLATSPRWPRTEGTFGENPALVRRICGAYVEGAQGGRNGIGPSSVGAVIKHWVGYGASRDGFDGHSYYGRYSAFPSGALNDHIDAFRDAIDAGVAGVMPTYNILEGAVLNGRELEQVGAGFNREILAFLREELGFDGVILSDWAITRALTESGRTGVPPQGPREIAMPWGVDHLAPVERFAKAINAGVDQIGGEDDPEPIIAAVEQGLVSMARIDDAVGRILLQTFRLGLFDAPFVDPARATEIVGCDEFRADGAAAQRAALCILTSTRSPLVSTTDVVYADGIDATPFAAQGIATAERPEDATVAVIRVDAPHQDLHPEFFFGRMQHEGDLDFKPDDPVTQRLHSLTAALPTIVIAHLDRPAILTELVDRATSLIGEFGASDEAIADVLTGAASATGRLPFRLPTSMASVLAQPCDRPDPAIANLFDVFHAAD